MDEKLKDQLVEAVRLALRRVDLTMHDQIELLETTLDRLRVEQAVDEGALVEMVN